MEIFIRLKAAGRRRDMLQKTSFILPDDTDSPEKLITFLVRENVRAFNAREVDAPLFRYLSKEELDDGAYTGKIAFGDRRGQKDQDEDEAIRNALQSFADGLYLILINDADVSSGPSFSLGPGDTVTFIRLVMLAGRRF
jgi:hypothetical protein